MTYPPLALGLLVLLHGYIGARLVAALPPAGWAPAVAFVLLVFALVYSGLSHVFGPRPTQGWWAWIGLSAIGYFSSLLVLTLLRDLGLGVAWLGEVLGLGRALDDRLRLASAVAVPVLALAASGLGLFIARRVPPVRQVDVPIAGLPDELHGFTVVQISDLHVGPTIRRPFVTRVVQAVNRLQADVVAVTGDSVDGSVAELAEHIAPLAQLQARCGVYAVTGNHEYYSGGHAWIAELNRLGLRVLMNEHVVIARGKARLLLAGVPDYTAHQFDRSHRSDPALALRGAPDDVDVKLLLAHQPRSAPAAARAGFHLQLSGHTHGGQFLPWKWFVPLQQPYTEGLKRHDGLWVYISRGTGYWGPPKRLGAPSEITQLRLVRAAARS
ncbi:metallophosphoesterase [Caldimonas brevitalea]|uniref:Serine/threonine protein phosphatase n=1 Tax=Caldimonas brevitalea TaxID=413882 RepID=A0A0G3BSV2_9BURK|nr:metallophosphoesterase [Caldimonas brevitalea]AKJ29615.1 serine/threonine protein phosphatase [Caldimonas brevitalea]